LFVRNDSEMLAWLERKDGWLVQVARELGETLSAETDSATPPAAKPNATAASDERLRELVAAAYFRTVSRPPSGGELERGVAHLKSTENRVEGLRDLLWALLNCREFITNH
jgi:hypothetical protein